MINLILAVLGLDGKVPHHYHSTATACTYMPYVAFEYSTAKALPSSIICNTGDASYQSFLFSFTSLQEQYPRPRSAKHSMTRHVSQPCGYRGTRNVHVDTGPIILPQAHEIASKAVDSGEASTRSAMNSTRRVQGALTADQG